MEKYIDAVERMYTCTFEDKEKNPDALLNAYFDMSAARERLLKAGYTDLDLIKENEKIMKKLEIKG